MTHRSYNVTEETYNKIVTETYRRQRDRFIHIFGDAFRMACDYRAGKLALTK